MSNNINSIVVGAGRLGSNIAKHLYKQNLNVLLVDKNKTKAANVVDYGGFLEVGDATDLTFLEENGINEVKRAVFVTDDDSTNIFLGDIACYLYNIEEIYIRLKDSRKRKIVNPRIRCIAPFDLSLDDFAKQMKEEG